MAARQDIGASDQVLRWILEGVRIPFKDNRPPPNFHNGISMQDATPAELTFPEGELARFVESGAWEFGTCRKWRGARILPSVDDFLLFSASMEQALHLHQRLASLLDSLGLQWNPTKGLWEPCQFGWHLGVDID
eukprot:jgi/Tetstr1/438981/TSEL_027473.t1